MFAKLQSSSKMQHYVATVLSRRAANLRQLLTSCERTRSKKENWAKLKRKKFATDHALENFDEYYGPMFGERWPSIRLALLCPQMYCAVVNNYADVDHVTKTLELTGAVDIRARFNARLVTEIKEPSVDDGQRPRVFLEESQSVGSAIQQENSIDIDEADRLRFKSHADLQSGFNEFVPATKLSGLKEYVTEADYLSTYKPDEQVHFESVIDEPTMLPPHWKIHAFKRGEMQRFPPPRRGPRDVFDYFLMDAASLLPVFALNVRDGDCVLDLCSAPGGKTLAILQTLECVDLVSNDLSISRIKRLHGVLDSYVPSDEEAYSRVKVMTTDGMQFDAQQNRYDKILVDVPCTTDRLAANENDNNIFHPMRMKERIQLPKMQLDLLCAALRAVKVGGTVVYSTCSLSPIQNDGVVHMALRHLWETTSSNFVVHDLCRSFRPFDHILRFHREPALRYGQLVVPFLLMNFGPMYVCKLSKVDFALQSQGLQ